MNKVEKIFKAKAFERGGLFLYSRENAIAFVKACSNEQIHLLGIEGFFLTNNSIQPDLTNSIDFSSSFFEGDAYKKAIVFLETSSDDLFFEIVCE